MRFDKLIILTGHRKSGTSMFHRLFDNHPDIYVYPVDISVLYAYFPYFVKQYYNQTDILKSRLHDVIVKSLGKFNEYLFNVHNFSIKNFAEDVCKKLEDKDLTSKNIVIQKIADSWIEMFYKSEMVKPFLFKETSQSIFLHEFIDFDVPVKMISLIRDPRDNYAAIKAGVSTYYSKLNENELESLASLINRARMDLISAKINKEIYSENFKSIIFENLVSDTKNNIKEISKFLNINFNEELLNPTSFGESYQGNSFEGKKFNGVSNSNVNKWQSRITMEEAQIIEYWLYDVMNYWGYKMKYSLFDSEKAFADFYNWYNTRYFYRDSFAKKE